MMSQRLSHFIIVPFLCAANLLQQVRKIPLYGESCQERLGYPKSSTRVRSHQDWNELDNSFGLASIINLISQVAEFRIYSWGLP